MALTTSEILEFIRAGYAKSEIDALVSGDPAPTPAQDPAPTPAQDPAPTPAPEKEPTPAPAPEAKPTPVGEPREQTEVEKLVAALGVKLDTLAHAMQARNVNTLEGQSAPQETTETILARIINPKGE